MRRPPGSFGQAPLGRRVRTFIWHDLFGAPMQAPFYPKSYNHWNCRVSPMFLRKWRGIRRRGRAQVLARRAMRVVLTPAEIDHLAAATLSRVRSEGRVIVLDRQHCTPVMNWIEARKP